MKCYVAHYQMINSRIIDNYSNGKHSNGNGNGNGNIDNKPFCELRLQTSDYKQQTTNKIKINICSRQSKTE